MVISSICFAEDGTDLFVSACFTCSTLRYFPTRPIKFLICGVVVQIPVVDAKLLINYILKSSEGIILIRNRSVALRCQTSI